MSVPIDCSMDLESLLEDTSATFFFDFLLFGVADFGVAVVQGWHGDPQIAIGKSAPG